MTKKASLKMEQFKKIVDITRCIADIPVEFLIFKIFKKIYFLNKKFFIFIIFTYIQPLIR